MQDYTKGISLDPRLSQIADMLGSCERCGDIGSDHGRLGAFLLQQKRCKHVTFTDISAPSLQKARRLIALLALEHQASFCVGDGANALDEKVDVAVIAGMGGETIASIVEGANGHLDGARLILQPNVAAPQLRARLNRNGWSILDEKLVRDGRRIYLILEAKQGQQNLSAMEIEVGPILLRDKPPLLYDYALFRLRVAQKALSGAQKGDEKLEMEALEREIAVWEEVSACL